jgi:hypothetical protein
LPANADAASLGSGREIAMLDAPWCRQRQPEDGQRETDGQAKPIPDAEHRLAEVGGQRKLMDPALPRVAEVIARVTGVSTTGAQSSMHRLDTLGSSILSPLP